MMFREEELRGRLKEMIPFVQTTALIVASDEQQEPVDPEMVEFWKHCLENQYALRLYLDHLNRQGQKPA